MARHRGYLKALKIIPLPRSPLYRRRCPVTRWIRDGVPQRSLRKERKEFMNMNNFQNTQNQWPIELIYRDPSAGFSYPPVLPLVDFDGVLYMPDFLAAVNSEIEWVSDEAPSIPYDVLHQIGLGLLECPICNGHQSYDLPKQGRTTGVVVAVRNECPCVRIRLYHRVMSKNVPARFRAVALLR